MGAGATDFNLQLQATLFANSQQIGQVPRRLDGHATALVYGEGCRQLLWMVFSHPAKTIAAAMFLIGAGGQNQAVLERDVVPLENPHGD